MENGDGYIWDNNLDLRDNCNSGWEQQQSNDGRNSAALINECQHQWRVQPDVLNVNSMKLTRATVECNASSSLLLLYVTWLSSFSASLLLWQIWHESTLCDVTLRLISSQLMWITPGYIQYTGKSVTKYGWQRRRKILRNLSKALNLLEIDCSPSLAVELHQICLKPLYEVTRDCNASDHLTSLMHWGAGGEWAGMQASWSWCIILARCPRCSSRLLPSLLTDCFWRESRRITFAILWREKRQTREHRSPSRSWWEGGRRGRLDLK